MLDKQQIEIATALIMVLPLLWAIQLMLSYNSRIDKEHLRLMHVYIKFILRLQSNSIQNVGSSHCEEDNNAWLLQDNRFAKWVDVYVIKRKGFLSPKRQIHRLRLEMSVFNVYVIGAKPANALLFLQACMQTFDVDIKPTDWHRISPHVPVVETLLELE